MLLRGKSCCKIYGKFQEACSTISNSLLHTICTLNVEKCFLIYNLTFVEEEAHFDWYKLCFRNSTAFTIVGQPWIKSKWINQSSQKTRQEWFKYIALLITLHKTSEL